MNHSVLKMGWNVLNEKRQTFKICPFVVRYKNMLSLLLLNVGNCHFLWELEMEPHAHCVPDVVKLFRTITLCPSVTYFQFCLFNSPSIFRTICTLCNCRKWLLSHFKFSRGLRPGYTYTAFGLSPQQERERRKVRTWFKEQFLPPFTDSWSSFTNSKLSYFKIG